MNKAKKWSPGHGFTLALTYTFNDCMKS